jgi:hypothetical protein
VTIVASADKDSKGVAGDCVPLHCIADVIIWACQVAVNAADVGLNVDSVGKVLCPILVTAGA